jgi:hypothetical protein
MRKITEIQKGDKDSALAKVVGGIVKVLDLYAPYKRVFNMTSALPLSQRRVAAAQAADVKGAITLLGDPVVLAILNVLTADAITEAEDQLAVDLVMNHLYEPAKCLNLVGEEQNTTIGTGTVNASSSVLCRTPRKQLSISITD